MSAGNIDALLDLWRASLLKYGGTPPFSNHVDLYRTIDSTPLGEVRWQCFTLRYPEGNVPGDGAGAPSWMTDSHEVWYRDPRAIIKQMLANPDFKGQLDYAPLREFSADGTRRLCNFMSGDWAWRQAVRYSTPVADWPSLTFIVGYSGTGCGKPWRRLRTGHPWQRQNHGLSRHRSE